MTVVNYITPIIEGMEFEALDAYLASEPHISTDCSLRKAVDLMLEHGMPFLPVYEDGSILGVVFHFHITFGLLDKLEGRTEPFLYSDN